MSDLAERALVALVVVIGAGLIAVAVWASFEEFKRWEQFKVDHACKVVGHAKGKCRSGFGTTSDGKMISTFDCDPDQTEWLCDDGVTYWR